MDPPLNGQAGWPARQLLPSDFTRYSRFNWLIRSHGGLLACVETRLASSALQNKPDTLRSGSASCDGRSLVSLMDERLLEIEEPSCPAWTPIMYTEIALQCALGLATLALAWKCRQIRRRGTAR